MKPPCIVMVQFILPALRVLVTRELVEKYGLKQTEVARRMGITPAAVTQYLKSVRGGSAVKRVEDLREVCEAASKIAEDLINPKATVESTLEEICKICTTLRSKGILCEMHKEVLPALRGRPCNCQCPLHISKQQMGK